MFGDEEAMTGLVQLGLIPQILSPPPPSPNQAAWDNRTTKSFCPLHNIPCVPERVLKVCKFLPDRTIFSGPNAWRSCWILHQLPLIGPGQFATAVIKNRDTEAAPNEVWANCAISPNSNCKMYICVKSQNVCFSNWKMLVMKNRDPVAAWPN